MIGSLTLQKCIFNYMERYYFQWKEDHLSLEIWQKIKKRDDFIKHILIYFLIKKDFFYICVPAELWIMIIMKLKNEKYPDYTKFFKDLNREKKIFCQIH